MHGWGIGAKTLVLTGLAAGVTFAAVARAQDSDGGLTVDLTVSERLRYSDNPDFVQNGTSDIRSVTDLTLAIAAATRTERFSFVGGNSLELGNGSENSPFARLNYARESSNALLDFGLNYRQSDISDSILFTDVDGDLIPDLLVVAGGQRRTYGGDLMLELGRDAPFGTTLELSRTYTEYVNSTSPGLFDGVRDRADLRLRFDVSEQTSLGVFATYDEEDEDPGGTDTSTQRFGVSLDIAFNAALSGRFSLSSDETETRVGAAPPTSTDGLSFSASLTQDVSNGSFTGMFETKVVDTGRRDTLQFTRALDLPDGTLSFSLGATALPSGSTRPLINLQYSREFQRSQFTAQLRQAASTSDRFDIVNTSFDLSYVQELSSLSSLTASVELRDIDGVNIPARDARSVDLSLTYRHDLGQDWDFVGGYEHRKTTSGTTADISSNSVFFGLSKSLSWRP